MVASIVGRPRPFLMAVAAVAGFAVHLFVRQDRIVFRPRPITDATPADLKLAYEDVWLSCAEERVNAWWVPRPGAKQAVLYLHGSDGNISYELSTLRFIAGLGLSALMVDYPGYGRSPGRPSERGCYASAESGWRFLTEQQHLAPSDIVVFGRSLGSAAATHLATRTLCRGLVFHSGFSSIPDMAAVWFPYLPVRIFCRTRMDSLARIAQVPSPLLCVHSTDDEHVPIAQGLKVFSRARGPKRFVHVTGSHASSRWETSPELIGAWEELLAGSTNGWEQV